MKKKESTKEKVELKEALADEKVRLEVEKDVVPGIPATEEEVPAIVSKSTFDSAGWTPKTSIGIAVKAGTITKIDEIIDQGWKILEAPIVDMLLPGLESDLLMIGQSKGKFGGGAKRAFAQTQKKTKEGNKPSFGTYAVVGNHDGFVGLGYGKSKETVPAREKAMRNAKTNVFKIRRGCGSWECGCKESHSIPMKVVGKCGSVRLTLLPAPRGKGLIISSECAKVLRLAGIKDVWSKTEGQTRGQMNVIHALIDALQKLSATRVTKNSGEILGMIDGQNVKS